MRRLDKAVTVGLAAVLATTAGLLPAAPAAADHPRDRSALTLWAATTVPTATDGQAYVYNSELVPAGASLAVLTVSRRRTETWLAVTRLRPNRVYGAHLHVNACGELPTAAGPHYQRVADPVQPSADPRYANPRNEVWLDLRTNSRGAATVNTMNPWRYRGAVPQSLVLHEMGTATHPGHAGTAGARIACLTLTRR